MSNIGGTKTNFINWSNWYCSLIHAYPIWMNPVLYNLNTMEFASPWQENNTSRLAGFSVQLTTLRSQVWESNSKPYSTPFKKNWHAKWKWIIKHIRYIIQHSEKNTVFKKYLLLDPNCSPCTPQPIQPYPTHPTAHRVSPPPKCVDFHRCQLCGLEVLSICLRNLRGKWPPPPNATPSRKSGLGLLWGVMKCYEVL